MEKLAILGGEPVRKKPYYSTAVIGDEERERVASVLESGKLSGFIANASEAFYGGEQVREFEKLASEYFKVPHVVTVNSATAGLHAALGACGIGPGDEVIVPPYTMAATATAVVMNQAVPVFADIETETFGLDPASVEKNITPRTKAILVVHLFGHCAKISEIQAIAKKHKLFLLEDCAQSPGARHNGKLAGTFGDVGIFSLNQHKTITCGEGGFCILNDARLARRVQLIRNHGEAIVNAMGVSEIDNMIGFNYRMTELEAAVAIGQFRRLDSLNDHRIMLADYLSEKLKQFNFLSLPKHSEKYGHVYFVYPKRYDAQKAGLPRKVFVDALLKEGIPMGAGYVRPLYWEPMFAQKIAYGKKGWPFTNSPEVSYAKGLCPNVEKMHTEELISTAICRHPHTKADMDDFIQAVEKIMRNKDALLAVQV